jgi:hypothetical protein
MVFYAALVQVVFLVLVLVLNLFSPKLSWIFRLYLVFSLFGILTAGASVEWPTLSTTKIIISIIIGVVITSITALHLYIEYVEQTDIDLKNENMGD